MTGISDKTVCGVRNERRAALSPLLFPLAAHRSSLDVAPRFLS